MKLETRTKRYNAARDAWEQAIVDAREAGMALRDIAAAAGISHEGVRKILAKRGIE